MADSGGVGRPQAGRAHQTRVVRYRTVGDMSRRVRRGRVAGVILPLAERGATRADDRLSEAAMEDRKKQGYF